MQNASPYSSNNNHGLPGSNVALSDTTTAAMLVNFILGEEKKTRVYTRTVNVLRAKLYYVRQSFFHFILCASLFPTARQNTYTYNNGCDDHRTRGDSGRGRVANVRGARDREVMYKVRQSTDVMSNRCSSARPVLPGFGHYAP